MIFSQKIKSNVFEISDISPIGSWGEGTINEGMAFFHSRPRWDSLNDDELVFYTPFLVSDQQTPERVRRLKSHLVLALSCKLWWSTQVLQQLGFPNWSVKNFEARLNSSQALNGIGTFSDLLNRGAKNAHTWFGKTHLFRLKTLGLFNAFSFCKASQNSSTETYEASEIEILTLLAICIRKIDTDPYNLVAIKDTSLFELGLAAIHSGINPVYFTKGCTFLHETLTAACWTGFLLRGRSAYLSPEIASTLKQILSFKKGRGHSFEKMGLEVMTLDEQIALYTKFVCNVKSLKKSIDFCLESSSVTLVHTTAHNPKEVLSKNFILKHGNKDFCEPYDLQVAV